MRGLSVVASLAMISRRGGEGSISAVSPLIFSARETAVRGATTLNCLTAGERNRLLDRARGCADC